MISLRQAQPQSEENVCFVNQRSKKTNTVFRQQRKRIFRQMNRYKCTSTLTLLDFLAALLFMPHARYLARLQPCGSMSPQESGTWQLYFALQRCETSSRKVSSCVRRSTPCVGSEVAILMFSRPRREKWGELVTSAKTWALLSADGQVRVTCN